MKLMHDFLVDFSLKWPEKVQLSISDIIEICNNVMRQKWQKHQIQDLLNKVYPKGKFSK